MHVHIILKKKKKSAGEKVCVLIFKRKFHSKVWNFLRKLKKFWNFFFIFLGEIFSFLRENFTQKNYRNFKMQEVWQCSKDQVEVIQQPAINALPKAYRVFYYNKGAQKLGTVDTVRTVCHQRSLLPTASSTTLAEICTFSTHSLIVRDRNATKNSVQNKIYKTPTLKNMLECPTFLRHDKHL